MKKFLTSIFAMLMAITISAQGNYMTKEGIGPIKLGETKVFDVPASLDGVFVKRYDPMGDFSGENWELTCFDSEERTIMFHCSDDVIVVYIVSSPNVTTAAGLSIANTCKELLAGGGKMRKITSDEGSSVYFVTVDGVNFFFDETSIDRGRIKPDAKPFCATNSEYPYYG